jgi:hypothetical protein
LYWKVKDDMMVPHGVDTPDFLELVPNVESQYVDW